MNLGIILTPYGQIPGAYPSEVGYSYGGDGNFLCPFDYYFNTRGEAGFYYDTQLGAPAIEYGKISSKYDMNFVEPKRLTHRFLGEIKPETQATTHRPDFPKRVSWISRLKNKMGLGRSVPSDLELYPTYGFAPHMNGGWVTTKEGFYPGSWIPPNGWNPAGSYGPQIMPRHLGLGDAVVLPPVLTTDQPAPPVTAVDMVNALNQQNQRMFTLQLITGTVVAISAIVATVRTARLIRQESKLLRKEVRENG